MAAFGLDEVEIRVLGALSEKDLATPEYYPLSLNSPRQRLQPEIKPRTRHRLR